MTQHIGRKVFTPWSELNQQIRDELAVVLKKHGLQVYQQPGISASPGVVSLEDDPVFAEMEARAAAAATTQTAEPKPLIGDQK